MKYHILVLGSSKTIQPLAVLAFAFFEGRLAT